MPRPRNQELRRSQLRSAASRVLARRDVAGVRLKDIAEQAGLAPASVLYYYPDLELLLREAFTDAIERFSARRRAAADALDDPRDRLIATLRCGLPSGPDDEQVAALYQGAGFVGSDPGLAAVVRRLTEEQVELYRRILEDGAARGLFVLAGDSRAIARNLVALEDAYGLYVIDVGMPVDEAQEAILSFARMATRCELPLSG